jgi:hypothetical protein
VEAAPGPVITHVEEDLKPLPMTDVSQAPQEPPPSEKPVEKPVEKAKRGKVPAKVADPEPLPEPVWQNPSTNEIEVVEVDPEPESDDPFKGF